MMGQCEESAKDYAALEAIDPKHADLESLFPLARACAQHLADGAAAEARKDWQVRERAPVLVGWAPQLATFFFLFCPS